LGEVLRCWLERACSTAGCMRYMAYVSGHIKFAMFACKVEFAMFAMSPVAGMSHVVGMRMCRWTVAPDVTTVAGGDVSEVSDIQTWRCPNGRCRI